VAPSVLILPRRPHAACPQLSLLVTAIAIAWGHLQTLERSGVRNVAVRALATFQT
jgi:hypothetical protein